MMRRRTRVYIAGPYSGGDQAANVRRAIMMWVTLWKAGYSPFCPHLSHFIHMIYPLHYEDWLAYDFDWLLCCDAVLRLDGASSGSEREEMLAKEHGIAIYYELVTLFREVEPTKED